MNQSRKLSAVEAVLDTSLGFAISILSYLVVLPYLGVPVSLTVSGVLTVYFTALSFIRKYLTRRFFNSLKNSCDD